MKNIKIDIQLSGMGKLQRLLKKADKLRMELTETLGEIGKLTLPIKVKRPQRQRTIKTLNKKGTISKATIKKAVQNVRNNI